MSVDMTELFSRDPLSLSDTDLDNIIKVFREKRAAFKSMPAGHGKAAGPKALTEKQKAATALDIDFKI